MKTGSIKTIAIAVTLVSLPVPGSADSFGTGLNQFQIDFVNIDHPGNANDNTGFGGVGYGYRMGAYEISRGMLIAASSEGSLGLTAGGATGLNIPVNDASWNTAARFVNWLNTSHGFQPAYQFSTNPGDVGYNSNEDISLWSSAEAWQLDGENRFRHKDAYYFLPSEDEWYKAAYYDGTASLYYDYATGSDSPPTPTIGGTLAGTAVYDPLSLPISIFGEIMNAGGLSPYGTMAQSGNVFEWSESGFSAPNDDALETRAVRGGSFVDSAFELQSNTRFDSPHPFTGFRVAAISGSVVPEPSTAGLSLLSVVGLVMRRKR